MEQAEVKLHFGLVDSLPSDSPSLMEGQFQHDRGTKVVKSFQASDGEGKLRLEGRGVFFPFPGGRESSLPAESPSTCRWKGAWGKLASTCGN